VVFFLLLIEINWLSIFFINYIKLWYYLVWIGLNILIWLRTSMITKAMSVVSKVFFLLFKNVIYFKFSLHIFWYLSTLNLLSLLLLPFMYYHQVIIIRPIEYNLRSLNWPNFKDSNIFDVFLLVFYFLFFLLLFLFILEFFSGRNFIFIFQLFLCFCLWFLIFFIFWPENSSNGHESELGFEFRIKLIAIISQLLQYNLSLGLLYTLSLRNDFHILFFATKQNNSPSTVNQSSYTFLDCFIK